MSFANLTRFAALDVPVTDPNGCAMVLVVVKGTFDPNGKLLGERAPIWAVDVPWDPDAADGSVRFPSDLALAKAGADVVVVGSARSRRPVKVQDLVVRVADRRLHLRVHGERVFYRGVGGVVVGDAAPFDEKPIRYERSFGGADKRAVERRNPVGRGVADDATTLVDKPAPQIEWGDEPVTTANGRYEPAGLGAIPAHWMPRAGYAGTCDEGWQRERMPIMPEDFDLRFYRCAHPRLQLDRMISPGMAVGVDGMNVEGPLAVTVAPLDVTITGVFDDGSRQDVVPAVDTLIIDTDGLRVMLAARASFPLGRGKRRLRALRVEPRGGQA
jgi:hypothetical protein